MPEELFRFRVVRDVARSSGEHVLHVVPPPPVVVRGEDGGGEVLPSLDDAWDRPAWLETVNDRLAAASDEMSGAAVLALLDGDQRGQVTGKAWNDVADDLARVLAAYLQTIRDAPRPEGVPPQVTAERASGIEHLCRLLLVHDLLRSLVAEAGDWTAAQVVDALALRHLTLPPELFPDAPRLVRPAGVTDLVVVRSEWNRYRADEIAQVVNVLPGETLDHRVRHVEESEMVQTSSSTTTTVTTREQDQRTSTNLAQTTSQDASLNVSAHGQVDVSAQYGPVKVTASAGAQMDSAQRTSRTSAVTTSSETVDRAIKTITATITEARVTRTRTSDQVADRHTLDNRGSNAPVVGVYRWLSEVRRVQSVLYPNRLVVEVELPEPGAWLRWALTNQPEEPYEHLEPAPFTVDDRVEGKVIRTRPLAPYDITRANYQELQAMWGAVGLTPPPERELVLGLALGNSTTSNGRDIVHDVVIVPDGYEAVGWSATVTGLPNAQAGPAAAPEIWVAVQGGGMAFARADARVTGLIGGDVANDNNTKHFDFVRRVTGTIAITVTAWVLDAWSCVVNVSCAPMSVLHVGQGEDDPRKDDFDEAATVAYQQWQEDSYKLLLAAYAARAQAYAQERAARKQQRGDLTESLAGPPAVNMARVLAELKRLSIQSLLNGRSLDTDCLVREPSTGEPRIQDHDHALRIGRVVQFFEQVFEWENLTYICYPYFWGDRTDRPTNALTASADPLFDQFLGAGSVRVVLPARPGLENLVGFFLATGILWFGRTPPGPGRPGYVSVADEITAVQRGAADGTPLEAWEITVPTTLLWAGTDDQRLPRRERPTILLPGEAPEPDPQPALVPQHQ